MKDFFFLNLKVIEKFSERWYAFKIWLMEKMFNY